MVEEVFVEGHLAAQSRVGRLRRTKELSTLCLSQARPGPIVNVMPKTTKLMGATLAILCRFSEDTNSVFKPAMRWCFKLQVAQISVAFGVDDVGSSDLTGDAISVSPGPAPSHSPFFRALAPVSAKA
jgi:hypothetical protein